ncbi:MAG TPA: hypothetical protein VKT77_09245 [Chthonomonadaceae bacterium]|nr:hypothetical protein [Chthonomonadaceae bacterium]
MIPAKLRVLRRLAAVLVVAVSAVAPPASAQRAVAYTAWKDPIEGAFTTEVPEGWKITGGTYRFAPVDVRVQIDAGSPDGATHVRVGDSLLTTYALPGPSSQRRGLREGQSYEVNGITYTVLHAVTGAEFSRLYVQTKLAKEIQGLKIGETRDRPDVAQSLGEPLQGGATLGETEFTYTRGGHAMQGACYVRIDPSFGAIFRADPSVVLAPAGGLESASGVLLHIVGHIREDPRWKARMTVAAKDFSDRVLRDHDAVMAELHAEYKKCISRINATAALWQPVLNPHTR